MDGDGTVDRGDWNFACGPKLPARATLRNGETWKFGCVVMPCLIAPGYEKFVGPWVYLGVDAAGVLHTWTKSGSYLESGVPHPFDVVQIHKAGE